MEFFDTNYLNYSNNFAAHCSNAVPFKEKERLLRSETFPERQGFKFSISRFMSAPSIFTSIILIFLWRWEKFLFWTTPIVNYKVRPWNCRNYRFSRFIYWDLFVRYSMIYAKKQKCIVVLKTEISDYCFFVLWRRIYIYIITSEPYIPEDLRRNKKKKLINIVECGL